LLEDSQETLAGHVLAGDFFCLATECWEPVRTGRRWDHSEQYAYDAHGHRVRSSKAGETRYPMYSRAGQLMYDESTGGERRKYYYLGSRLVGQTEGVSSQMRFISPDPVGVSGSNGGNFNRYWYANNNPYTYVDPDGRQTVDASGRTLTQACGQTACTLINFGTTTSPNRNWVPVSVSSDSYMAMQTGTSVDDYTHLTKSEMLDAADNTSDGLGITAFAAARVPGGQSAAAVIGSVAVAVKILAFAADSTPDRSAEIAVDLVLPVASKVVKGDEVMMGVVDAAERIMAGKDALEVYERSRERDDERQ
jgi:RHS repeat-associated protein